MVKGFQLWRLTYFIFNFVSFTRIATVTVFVACVLYVIIDMDDYRNLISLTGIAFFLTLCFLLSYYPSDVSKKLTHVYINVKSQLILSFQDKLALFNRWNYIANPFGNCVSPIEIWL